MKRILLGFIIVGIILGMTACQQEEETLVIGFFPAQDSDKMADTIEPLAERLSEELGMRVEGSVMTNYNALVDAMGANEIQIGFIPAFGYILANEEYDAQVILKSLRNGEGSYKAQYLVKTDDDIEELTELENVVWALPDKA